RPASSSRQLRSWGTHSGCSSARCRVSSSSSSRRWSCTDWSSTASRRRSKPHNERSRRVLCGVMSAIQQFLRARLVDELHVAMAPIFLGGGERLFDHLDGGPRGYEFVELVSSPSAVHIRLARTP